MTNPATFARRLVPIALGLLAVPILAGCAAPAPAAAPHAGQGPPQPSPTWATVPRASAPAASPAAPKAPTNRSWSQQGSVALGWEAGFGQHVYVGETTFGETSEARCPDASFVVPAGASRLDVSFRADAVNTTSPG